MNKKIFEKQLALLDLMLNDMSNITLADVQKWLDDTKEKLKSKNKKDYYKLTDFDKKHYKELNLFENM